ncbi:hypothetical protein NA57DRAFT_57629 [Rhizodiscina lignyota]|uniref:Uncharacterized protein n=1 Tax=Rhizodiscina lignyota TaxID=1504668 RepID=A0A9P4ID13_9PEZI|nr:hypothetical protein NA57DRAFT_57629 [Rhizodiscina lignyota]
MDPAERAPTRKDSGISMGESTQIKQSSESWQQTITKKMVAGVSRNLHKARSSISNILEVAMNAEDETDQNTPLRMSGTPRTPEGFAKSASVSVLSLSLKNHLKRHGSFLLDRGPHQSPITIPDRSSSYHTPASASVLNLENSSILSTSEQLSPSPSHREYKRTSILSTFSSRSRKMNKPRSNVSSYNTPAPEDFADIEVHHSSPIPIPAPTVNINISGRPLSALIHEELTIEDDVETFVVGTQPRSPAPIAGSIPPTVAYEQPDGDVPKSELFESDCEEYQQLGTPTSVPVIEDVRDTGTISPFRSSHMPEALSSLNDPFVDPLDPQSESRINEYRAPFDAADPNITDSAVMPGASISVSVLERGRFEDIASMERRVSTTLTLRPSNMQATPGDSPESHRSSEPDEPSKAAEPVKQDPIEAFSTASNSAIANPPPYCTLDPLLSPPERVRQIRAQEEGLDTPRLGCTLAMPVVPIVGHPNDVFGQLDPTASRVAPIEFPKCPTPHTTVAQLSYDTKIAELRRLERQLALCQASVMVLKQAIETQHGQEKKSNLSTPTYSELVRRARINTSLYDPEYYASYHGIPPPLGHLSTPLCCQLSTPPGGSAPSTRIITDPSVLRRLFVSASPESNTVGSTSSNRASCGSLPGTDFPQRCASHTGDPLHDGISNASGNDVDKGSDDDNDESYLPPPSDDESESGDESKDDISLSAGSQCLAYDRIISSEELVDGTKITVRGTESPVLQGTTQISRAISIAYSSRSNSPTSEIDSPSPSPMPLRVTNPDTNQNTPPRPETPRFIEDIDKYKRGDIDGGLSPRYVYVSGDWPPPTSSEDPNNDLYGLTDDDGGMEAFEPLLPSLPESCSDSDISFLGLDSPVDTSTGEAPLFVRHLPNTSISSHDFASSNDQEIPAEDSGYEPEDSDDEDLDLTDRAASLLGGPTHVSALPVPGEATASRHRHPSSITIRSTSEAAPGSTNGITELDDETVVSQLPNDYQDLAQDQSEARESKEHHLVEVDVQIGRAMERSLSSDKDESLFSYCSQ